MNGLAGLGFDVKTQLGRKTHHTDDTNRVFAIADLWVTNHAQHALFDVLDAMMEVDHDTGVRVVVHGVDGEVAASGVLILRTPDVVTQHPTAGVDHVCLVSQISFGCLFVARHLFGSTGVQVGAEGRNFDDFVFASATKHHVNNAEAPSNDECATEQALDLFRRGVGGHVEVFGAQAQQQVTNRTADHVSLVTGLLQGFDNANGAVIQQVGVDAMLGCRHVDALACRDTCLGSATSPAFARLENFVNQTFDHANNRSTRQPRSRATSSNAGLGLVATGSLTRSSKGRSLGESL